MGGHQSGVGNPNQGIAKERMERLKTILRRIDGRGYKAYKGLEGQGFTFPGFTLFADHVQADPFATPSRFRVRVPQNLARFRSDTYINSHRQIALRDFLVRAFAREVQMTPRGRGTGGSGRVFVDPPGKEILERSACQVNRDFVELRFFVGLPAAGRRILGTEAERMLLEALPPVVGSTLYFASLDEAEVRRHVETAEDAEALRAALGDMGLAAIVADDSVLPRRTGVDDRPMTGAVPFRSPEGLKVTVELPNRGSVTGMGIPRGVTLIVGGGFHGKSTLLRALERGVYNHVPGDGRELVVADPTAVKVRAEDGRSVAGLDISPFIGSLPGGVLTRQFVTQNSSGSTSQAANTAEALEAGSRLLLLDEDTSATNFMLRDRRMQALVHKRNEPITPFVDQVQRLFRDLDVSTVLVMGGSGDYFDVADTVIAMEEFVPREVTQEARDIARRHPTGRAPEGAEHLGPIHGRIPLRESIDPRKGRRDVSVRVRGTRTLLFGEEEIDLSRVEQLVEEGQVKAIGHAIAYMRSHLVEGDTPVEGLLGQMERDLAQKGLDGICTVRYPTDLAGFRMQELAAALNRLRTLRVRS